MSRPLKISDLPVYWPEQITVGFPMAVIDDQGWTRRVVIGDHTHDTEAKAIARIKEIYANNKKAFILQVQ